MRAPRAPASIQDKHAGSIKVTTHLNHISHCQAASGTGWLNRWTHRVYYKHSPRLNGGSGQDGGGVQGAGAADKVVLQKSTP